MNGILKYTRRLSSVIWKLLKYMRRLALTVCVLFTTVFWVVWAIALSQGLIYRFQYWKLGLRMTIVTLAALAATVLWRFLDTRHVGVLTAFLTFEVTLMFLWPMVDLYYEGFNWDLISYQIKWIDGNTYIKVDDYPEPERYYEIKGEGRFFWRILNGDIVNNKYALEKKYHKGFSEIICEDGITRYISNDYPEVKVRVYDNRDWKKGDIVDDYLQKMERYLILQCYKEEGMTWEYVYISSNSFGEGDL